MNERESSEKNVMLHHTREVHFYSSQKNSLIEWENCCCFLRTYANDVYDRKETASPRMMNVGLMSFHD